MFYIVKYSQSNKVKSKPHRRFSYEKKVCFPNWPPMIHKRLKYCNSRLHTAVIFAYKLLFLYIYFFYFKATFIGLKGKKTVFLILVQSKHECNSQVVFGNKLEPARTRSHLHYQKKNRHLCKKRRYFYVNHSNM